MTLALERTLVIIKPDAFAAGHTGKIIDRFIEEGLRIMAMKTAWLSRKQAEKFYYVHEGKGFFPELTEFMSSGPIVPMILEGEDAIHRVRGILGATDPAQALPGTLRKLFAESKGRNAVHGSDSQTSADYEMSFFFSKLDRVE